MSILLSLLKKVSQFLYKETIGGYKGEYLHRYLLYKSDRWGVYLHNFLRPDEDRHLHNHPFKFSFGVILHGWYEEERKINDSTWFRVFRPGMVNILHGNSFHRLSKVSPECWTLFFFGRKAQGWGFLNDDGRVIPWKQYVQEKYNQPRGEA